STDGRFELLLTADGLETNGQSLKLEAAAMPLFAHLRQVLAELHITGFAAREPPPAEELRLLAALFGRNAPGHLDASGDPKRPFTRLRLLLATGAARRGGKTRTVDERVAEAYAGAAVFVSRYIEGLRGGGGELPPLWAGSRIVQDLVDLESGAPLRVLALTRQKRPGDDYWGFHAANVAVLAIAFGRRLGLPRRRRYDLGMAALFHDVGMAALPASLLEKAAELTERERSALAANPLFAARVTLREREVHATALERAVACYECHLDFRPQDGSPAPEIGFCGRVLAICEAFDAMTTERPYRAAHSPAEALSILSKEISFRFDPGLLSLFQKALGSVLLNQAPAA
ncbi:MAG TPA: HD domain-containing phosphohydrolase, partial [Myxococcales bacterium]